MTQRRPHASRRLGDNFQDIVGIRFLMEMLQSPGNISWIEFEDAGAKSLDDVVVQRWDHRQYIQVKYAVDPEQTWSLDDLLDTTKGTSLLRKWASSWKHISSGAHAYKLLVVTNRVPDPGLAELLDADGRHISVSTTAPEWDALRNASGLADADARQFLRELEFSFGEPMLDSVEREVELGFRAMGATRAGWRSLLHSARRWVVYREPGDGRIRAGDVRVAAELWDPFEGRLPQAFPGDQQVYVTLTPLFNACFEFLITRAGGYLLVEGPPGVGKSSTLNAVAGRLRNASWADPAGVHGILKHHCFLAIDDPTFQRRLRTEDVTKDLFRQMYEQVYDWLVTAAKQDVALHLENPSSRVRAIARSNTRAQLDPKLL